MAGNSQQQERMARLPEAAEFINQPHLRNELRDIADRPWKPISPFPESGHLTAVRPAGYERAWVQTATNLMYSRTNRLAASGLRQRSPVSTKPVLTPNGTKCKPGKARPTSSSVRGI